MSEDMAANQTAGSKEAETRKKPKSAMIIPILLGATAWFALLGFGLDKIYSMAGDKSTQPAPAQTKQAAVPVENTLLQQQAVSQPAVQARFAVQMQDDKGQMYTVFLNAANETTTVQPQPATVAALPGDKLVHGDYATSVQAAGGGDIRKQAVTLPGMTFNLNRRQVYVMTGNPQVLTVTQSGDWNGVNAHFYTLIGGELTPVQIVRGQQTSQSLYLLAMKPLSPSRQFQSIDYNKANGHWMLITWQMDANNKMLREIGQRDLSQQEVAQVSHSWSSASSGYVYAQPAPSAWHPTGSTPSHSSGSGDGGNGGSSNGGGGQIPPAPAPQPAPPPSPSPSGGNGGGVDGSLYSHPTGGGTGNGGGVDGSLYSQPTGGGTGNGGSGSTGGNLYGPPVGCPGPSNNC